MLFHLHKSRLLFLVPAFLLLSFSASAATTSTPVCTAESYAAYIGLNTVGGCTIGDATFFRFAAPTPTSTGGAIAADPSQIFVTPLSSSAGVGFLFTSGFFSLSNPTTAQSVGYFLNYSIDPPPIVVGASIDLDPPFGNVSASQDYCLFDVFANGCSLGVRSGIRVTTVAPFATVTFPTPASFVDVQTAINLSSTPGNPAGFDGLSVTYAVLSQTSNSPEPNAGLLSMVGGLLVSGLLVARRRLTSRQR